MRLNLLPWAAIFLLAPLPMPAATPKAAHIVLVVWDGMRPDFVTKENTPALFGLAQAGVTFAHHHSVYPTSTEVNGTALATGVYPNRSGIMANREFRPELDPLKSVETQALEAVRKSDEVSAGKHLAVPTVVETIQRAGFRTAVAGTKGIALLFDRAISRPSDGAAAGSVTLFEGQSLPATALAPILERQGGFPPTLPFPDVARNGWTASALVDDLWKNELPKLSVLWLSEPDFSQHRDGPGSPPALAALKANDAILGKILSTLDERGWREKTDVLVVSDHGFSTISRSADVSEMLAAAGLPAFRTVTEQPKRGDILVVGNGGTLLFYVRDRDETVVRRLVEFLQKSDFAGVIFSRPKIDGTFSLADARLNTDGAPDVIMSFRWGDEINRFGVRGTVVADWSRKPGQGTHATLSRHDVHNTLIAAGPDFKRGWSDPLPSGNVDVAPTILSLLGIRPAQPLDGRVLAEAFADAAENPAQPKTRREESTAVFDDKTKWTQYLSLTEFEGHVYLDEGNGFRSEKPAE